MSWIPQLKMDFPRAVRRAHLALTPPSFEDDYSFGIRQSNAHWLWFVTKSSKLTERLRYSPESIFDTFPWPQLDVSPSAVRRDIVVESTG